MHKPLVDKLSHKKLPVHLITFFILYCKMHYIHIHEIIVHAHMLIEFAKSLIRVGNTFREKRRNTYTDSERDVSPKNP